MAGLSEQQAARVSVAARLRAAWDLRKDPLAARTRRLVLALIAIWVLNLFDLTFTVLAGRIGGFEEVNPLARDILHESGRLLLFKLVTLGLGTAILLLFRRHWVTEAAAWLVCGVYVALSFIWVAYYAHPLPIR